MRGQCASEIAAAKKAKEFTVTALMTAKKVELRSMQRDKYFRVLADVYVDDKNLSKMLIDNKLALPYGGQTKTNWCKLLNKKDTSPQEGG
jgi:micrococcal nuclease